MGWGEVGWGGVRWGRVVGRVVCGSTLLTSETRNWNSKLFRAHLGVETWKVSKD